MSDNITHFSKCSHNRSTRLRWEHDGYSGTITIPDDFHDGPIEIEWDDGELPDDWEDMEEIITDKAVNQLTKTA